MSHRTTGGASTTANNVSNVNTANTYAAYDTENSDQLDPPPPYTTIAIDPQPTEHQVHGAPIQPPSNAHIIHHAHYPYNNGNQQLNLLFSNGHQQLHYSYNNNNDNRNLNSAPPATLYNQIVAKKGMTSRNTMRLVAIVAMLLLITFSIVYLFIFKH
ncbi:hypothetical protein BDF19DRAFT_453506 [Syncephalis fuscata]|nr:hypothetical protein BDF19DRAFT_453506 [Syncephalis fuscata]